MTKASKKLIVYLFLISVILCSCSPESYKPLFKSRYDSISDTLRYVHTVNSKSPTSDIYRIQVYDMLSVRNIQIEQITQAGGGGGSQQVSGQNSEAGGFRVEADGNVNLPVIGSVYVKDLTRKEATDKIQELYKRTLLKDPLIDVAVLAPRVTIMGDVGSQGSFVMESDHLSIVDVIAMAGGLNKSADPTKVKIIRGDKANPEIIYVNLENLQSLASSKIMIQNKDIIYVDTDKQIAKYEKSQSVFGVFQILLVVLSTGILVYTTFFK